MENTTSDFARGGSSNEVRINPPTPSPRKKFPYRPTKLTVMTINFYHAIQKENAFSYLKPYCITLTPLDVGVPLTVAYVTLNLELLFNKSTSVFIMETENTNHFHGIIWLPGNVIPKNHKWRIRNIPCDKYPYINPQVQIFNEKLVKLNLFAYKKQVEYMHKHRPRVLYKFHQGEVQKIGVRTTVTKKLNGSKDLRSFQTIKIK